MVGVAVAAALGAFRGGEFGHEFENSLLIVGSFMLLMLLLAVFSFSPTTRRGPDELITVWTGRRSSATGLDECGGLGLSLTLVVGGLLILIFAFVNG